MICWITPQGTKRLKRYVEVLKTYLGNARGGEEEEACVRRKERLKEDSPLEKGAVLHFGISKCVKGLIGIISPR